MSDYEKVEGVVKQYARLLQPYVLDVGDKWTRRFVKDILRVLGIAPDEERARVDCDEDCGAFKEPVTLGEYKAALEHWKTHEWMSGCSHGE